MDKKTFYADEYNKDLEVYFLSPTHEELLAIDMEYRKIYSMAVRENVITNAEALKRHKNSGAWVKEDEEEITDYMFNLKLYELVINDKDNTDKQRRKAAFDATKLRTDLLQKMNTRTSLFDHTAESMAEEQKIHKFILLCCKSVDTDERLFDSREEQQQFANTEEEKMSTIYRKAYFFSYSLDDDITVDWAEVQYLKVLAEEEEKSATEAKAKAKVESVKPKKVRKKRTKKVTVE